MRKGRALKPGDTIGLTSPASPAKHEQAIKAIELVKSLGYKVKTGKSCFSEQGGYMAGSPLYRAQELNAMFRDPEITAILCMRGGYGSLQILPYINYSLIKEHPKLLIGYSDITALHIALQQKCCLATVHGPMAASDLIDYDPFTLQSLLQTVSDSKYCGRIENPNESMIECMVPGKTSGVLIGGNLAVLTSTLSTPFEINLNEKLLFLEDIHEEPYKIDRMMTQLSLAGKLQEAAGFVIGTWTECESESYPNGYSAIEVIQNFLLPLEKPAIFNVQAGHCSPMISLPLGTAAELDASKKELFFKESAVI